MVKKQASPFSVRFTAEERARLEQDAGGVSLGEHIRQCVLREGARKRKRARPLKDHTALSQSLMALGRSRVAENLNTLAEAAHAGTLTLDEDNHAVLINACADIREVRALLLAALGKRSGE